MTKSWKAEKLGAISTISYGFTESASHDVVGPHFLRITDIQDDGVNWSTVPYCKIAVENLSKYRLAHGDIVFARTGATTGKGFLVQSPPESVCASYLIRLRLTDSQVMPEFVSLFFQTAEYWKAVREGSSGSAQGGFNASKLADLTIQIPPISEQQRLVSTLNEAFDSIATARANAEKNLQNARAIYESHLQSVFKERAEGGVEKRLDEISTFSSGGTPSKANEGYWNGDIPWVSGRDMKSTRLSDSFLHISRSAVEDSSTRLAPAGTLLVLVRGMGLAHGAQITELMVPCAFNQDIKGIHVDPSVTPRYLLFALRNRINSSDSVLSNAAHGTLKINSGELSKLTVPVPALEEQHRVVNTINLLAEETQRLESIYQQKLAALDELKQSLLHQAFSGNL